MRFLPHAHRISLLSPAPVSHIFHNCRPSMPQTQKAALVPTPIKQSHKAMAFSYRPQTLHDTIHTVLPGEVLPAIPSYSEFIAVRLFVFQLTASRRDWRRSTPRQPTSAAFQLTASRRGWRNEHVRRSWAKRISTHSLTKRLTRKLQQSVSSLSHFNSQPHEEADWTLFYLYGESYISTHSLTKRLTKKRWYYKIYYIISTHSLTKRLTRLAHDQMVIETFQLTASRRGWRNCLLTESVWWEFQLTASRRGWRPDDFFPVISSVFQLTASRRGWQILP